MLGSGDTYEFNPDLIEDFALRRVVFFLGTGVTASASTNSGTRIKQWGEYLSHTASLLPPSVLREHAERLISDRDYLMACELIREALGRDRWEEELRKEFAQAGSASGLHAAIISLRQRLILTTNFDKFLETAWGQFNRDASHFPQVITRIDENVFKVLRDNADYIIKVHGSIDQPDSMIFAKSDYNKSAYGNWAYSKFIETLLLSYTVLFVGFSMNDPAISYVVEMYAQNVPGARPHYMFLAGRHSDEYIQISKKLRRLFIIPYSPDDNHSELTELMENLSKRVDLRRRLLTSENIDEAYKR